MYIDSLLPIDQQIDRLREILCELIEKVKELEHKIDIIKPKYKNEDD